MLPLRFTRPLVTVVWLAAAQLAAQTPDVAHSPDPRKAAADASLSACAAATAVDNEAEAKRTLAVAMESYIALAQERPQDPEPLVGQARVLSECELPFASIFRKGALYEKSVRLLEQALRLDSVHWGARYALALNHYHAPDFFGTTRAAIRQFELLLAQQGDAVVFPEQAAPYAYLGDLYKREQRDADAERVWRRGARLFPQDQRLKKRLERAP